MEIFVSRGVVLDPPANDFEETRKRLANPDREEDGAVSSATPGEAVSLEPSTSDPIAIELRPPLDPESNLDGKVIYVDGNVTVREAALALAHAGFMLYNDGTGRLVAKQVPTFLRAEHP